MTQFSSEIEQKLQYNFEQPALLQQALTHKSYSQSHNEKLEFIGDAALGAAIAKALFVKFPKANEGELSRLRALLICGESLAEIARIISLGEHIRLGGGELASGGKDRRSILADGVEALFGAVFLDTGYSESERVILNLFEQRLNDISIELSKDAKTRLQEKLQAQGKALPKYTVEKTEGAQHQQQFFVKCVALRHSTIGHGASRRAAEQEAAQLMLALFNESNETKA